MDETRLCVSVHEGEKTEVQIYDRRTLNLEKVLYEPGIVNCTLLVSDEILILGTRNGYVKILNWTSSTELGVARHPESSTVSALAFSTDTLVSRSVPLYSSDWSLVIIKFSSCFTKIIKESEIFFATEGGSKLCFDGEYLIINIGNPFKDLDSVIQIRKGEGWKLNHEITVPKHIDGLYYSNLLIFVCLRNELRIFEVETGLCKSKISLCFKLYSARLNFPFLIVSPLFSPVKMDIWNLSALTDKTSLHDFPHCQIMDIPSSSIVLFDEFQIIVLSYIRKDRDMFDQSLLVYDILSGE